MTKLDELRVALVKAGTGVWEVYNNFNALAYPGWELIDTSTIPPCVFAIAGTEDRFKYIALAHNLMPALLDAVDLIKQCQITFNTVPNFKVPALDSTSYGLASKLDAVLDKLQ